MDDFDCIDLPDKIDKSLTICFACSVAAKTAFDYIVAILIAPVTEEYFFRKGLYGYVREKI